LALTTVVRPPTLTRPLLAGATVVRLEGTKPGETYGVEIEGPVILPVFGGPNLFLDGCAHVALDPGDGAWPRRAA
jgi:hypothetical protein